MPRKTIYLAIGVLALGFSLFLFLRPEPSKETLVFFPTDDKVQYVEASSSLQVLKLNDQDEYTLSWSSRSTLDERVQLRHDLSLLFEDGVLKDTMSEAKQNSDRILLEKKIHGEDSGHYEIISFHHAEIHYPNDEKKSKHKMSTDELYVIDSPLSPLTSFRTPNTEKEMESKRILDNIVHQNLSYKWEDLIIFYNIPIHSYEQIPLTTLGQYQDKPLPGLTMDETMYAIGVIWESLYENYLLGIPATNGERMDPIGSTVPLLLLSKQTDHIVIVFETKDGEKVQLLKPLSFTSSIDE